MAVDAITAPVDLDSCAREPIHIPGSIQPHGYFFALDDGGFIRAVSDNLAGLGLAPSEQIGRRFAALLSPDDQRRLAAQIEGPPGSVDLSIGGARHAALIHRSSGWTIVELEPAFEGAGAASWLRLVEDAVRAVRSATTTTALLDAVVGQIRAITGFDRVMVYRFHPDDHGEVVGEARRADLEPFMGLHYPASDIPAQARRLYAISPLRIIPDVGYRPSRLVPDLPGPIDLGHAALRSVSPIHIEYLQNMGVAASMSISLVSQQRLWGLIACHHYGGPHFVPADVRQACAVLAGVFSSQTSDFERVDEAIAARRLAVVRAELGEAALRHRDLDPTAEVLGRLMAELGASGALMARGEARLALGAVPDPPAQLRLLDWLAGAPTDLVVETSLAAARPDLGLPAPLASGVLATRLPSDAEAWLIWFRPEAPRVVNWAGAPHKTYAEGPHGPRLTPRGSFALWQETMRGSAVPWTASEVDLVGSARALLVEVELERARERERLFRHVEESERRFRNMADHAPVMLWVSDADGRCVHRNRLWHEYTGQDEAAALGSGWLDAVHPDDLARTLDAFAGAGRARGRFRIQYRLRRADGAHRWALDTATPRLGHDGGFLGFIGSVIDVTEQVEAEEAQARRMAEQALLAEASGLVLESSDVDDWWRRTARAVAGNLGSRLVACFQRGADGAFQLAAVAGEDRGDPHEVSYGVAEVVASGRESTAADRPAVPGHPALRAWIGLPILAGDRVEGVLSVFDRALPSAGALDTLRRVAATLGLALEQRSLQQRQRALVERETRARREAEQANRLKDEFLATVSHELRTPLNAMTGWIHLLRGSLAPEKRERALEVLARNARAQTQLIDDLLDVSRVMSGQMSLELEPIEMPHVIEQAVEAARPAADLKEVRLQVACDSAGTIMGDPRRLQQVVWNLLSNAIKFTPRLGRVQVVCTRDHSAVEVVVADTGQGISSDFLPHVFDRFRQEDSTTSRRSGGLGLGLSISKHLVELHGGRIFAESAGPGTGATFSVRLPLAVARTPRETSPGALVVPVVERRLDGVRIVAVDDEPDSADLLATLLEREGARVWSSNLPAEALALVQREKPDLFISDIGMPGMDGYELIRRVRQLPADEGGGTYAVALTAYARSEERTRALVAGFEAHIAKPVDPDELVAVLRSILRRAERP